MGLDQYLEATIHVGRSVYGDTPEDIKIFKELIEKFNVDPDPNEFTNISIKFPMGYWRKANQIHNWFVKNVQNNEDDCGTYYVERDHLHKLKDLCTEVLANQQYAPELLPTSSGFFFGSTDYNEGYFYDLELTLEIVNRCLDSKFNYFHYSSSW